MLEDVDGLAEEQLGIATRVCVRRGEQRRRIDGDSGKAGGDKAGRFDRAAQALIGKIGAESIETSVEIRHDGTHKSISALSSANRARR